MGKHFIEKKLNIIREHPDNLESHFVTHMVVQNQPDHFILGFYEIWPPINLPGEENISDEIPAKCVSRLVIPASKMHEFVKVLGDNYNKWKEMVAQIEKQKIRKNINDK